MDYIEWFKGYFAEHPATVIGVGSGIVLGLAFAVFGFWKTLVVALCVGAGLLIGLQLDNGNDFSDMLERLHLKKKQ